MQKPHKRPGAPRKAPGGLAHVLFVRVDKKFVRGFDALLADRRARSPGVTLSRSDVAREILWAAIAARSTLIASPV